MKRVILFTFIATMLFGAVEVQAQNKKGKKIPKDEVLYQEKSGVEYYSLEKDSTNRWGIKYNNDANKISEWVLMPNKYIKQIHLAKYGRKTPGKERYISGAIVEMGNKIGTQVDFIVVNINKKEDTFFFIDEIATKYRQSTTTKEFKKKYISTPIVECEYDCLSYHRMLGFDTTNDYLENKFFITHGSDGWNVANYKNYTVNPIPLQCDTIVAIIPLDNYRTTQFLVKRNDYIERIDNVGTTLSTVCSADVDSCVYYKFDNTLWKNYKLPIAFLVYKNNKCGLVDIYGNVLLPIAYNNTSDPNFILYPQNSFSVYLYNHFNPKAKSEFETQSEYEARMNNPELQKLYLKQKIDEIEKMFVAQHTTPSRNSTPTFDLGLYNADNVQFPLSFSECFGKSYSLNIPRQDAPAFKSEFDAMKLEALKSAKFIIENDFMTVGSVTFTMSNGKTYTYTNPRYEDYKGATILDLNLK